MCARVDLDQIFEIIDANGDQTVSKNEYRVLISKFIEVMKAESVPAYEQLIRFSKTW